MSSRRPSSSWSRTQTHPSGSAALSSSCAAEPPTQTAAPGSSVRDERLELLRHFGQLLLQHHAQRHDRSADLACEPGDFRRRQVRPEVVGLEAAARADDRGHQQPELVSLTGQRREHDVLAPRTAVVGLEHQPEVAADRARHHSFLGDREFAPVPAFADLAQQRLQHLDEQLLRRQQRDGQRQDLLALGGAEIAGGVEYASREAAVPGGHPGDRSLLDQARQFGVVELRQAPDRVPALSSLTQQAQPEHILGPIDATAGRVPLRGHDAVPALPCPKRLDGQSSCLRYGLDRVHAPKSYALDRFCNSQ